MSSQLALLGGPKGSGLAMGGWYYPLGHYRPEELDGLSVRRFCQALTAEGAPSSPGCNGALHQHPLFSHVDIYHDGRPTCIANLPAGVDIREAPGSLPVAEGIQERVYSVPSFKHYRPEMIAEHAAAFRKVVEHYRDLLPGDGPHVPTGGRWSSSRRRG